MRAQERASVRRGRVFLGGGTAAVVTVAALLRREGDGPEPAHQPGRDGPFPEGPGPGVGACSREGGNNGVRGHYYPLGQGGNNRVGGIHAPVGRGATTESGRHRCPCRRAQRCLYGAKVREAESACPPPATKGPEWVAGPLARWVGMLSWQPSGLACCDGRGLVWSTASWYFAEKTRAVASPSVEIRG